MNLAEIFREWRENYLGVLDRQVAFEKQIRRNVMAGAYKYRPQYTQNTIGPDAGRPETPAIVTGGKAMEITADDLRDIVEKNTAADAFQKVMTRQVLDRVDWAAVALEVNEQAAKSE